MVLYMIILNYKTLTKRSKKDEIIELVYDYIFVSSKTIAQ